MKAELPQKCAGETIIAAMTDAGNFEDESLRGILVPFVCRNPRFATHTCSLIKSLLPSAQTQITKLRISVCPTYEQKTWFIFGSYEKYTSASFISLDIDPNATYANINIKTQYCYHIGPDKSLGGCGVLYACDPDQLEYKPVRQFFDKIMKRFFANIQNIKLT